MAQDSNNKDVFLTINGKELEVSHEVPMHIGETVYDENGKEVVHYCIQNPNYKEKK